MKLLIRIHRYLSCLVAPAMLFFAVTGAWQAFRFQDTKKDGSYTAPAIVERLSEVHMAEKLSKETGVWLKSGQVAIASLFAVTAIIGIIMAYRVTRPVWRFWLCLGLGVAIPVLLAVVAAR